MIAWVLRPGRALVKILTDADSAQQIALGLAIGMMLGLVPKGNLVAVSLGILLFASRANLGAGALSAFAFTWAGLLLDPVSHRIGLGLLEFEALRPMWTWLFNLPVVPWTALNNTVVLGSLILGMALFYPVFRLSEPQVAMITPRICDHLVKYRVGKVLMGVDLVTRGAA